MGWGVKEKRNNEPMYKNFQQMEQIATTLQGVIDKNQILLLHFVYKLLLFSTVVQIGVFSHGP